MTKSLDGIPNNPSERKIFLLQGVYLICAKAVPQEIPCVH